MNFQLSEDIKFLKQSIRDFVDSEVDPLAMEIEEKDEIPEKIMNMSKEMGLFGLSIPEEYGGTGIGMVGKCAIYEELGRTHNGYTTVIGAHTGIGSVGIVEMGNEEQKRKYLPSMARGEMIGAFALTEPSAGSHATNLKTTAVRKGDKYILNGSKALHYKRAYRGCIYGYGSDRSIEGSKRNYLFYRRERLSWVHSRKKEKKMGLHGSHSAEIFFEDCEVPLENVLGQEGQGYVNALKILANGRAGLAARNLGSCDKLLEMSIQHANTRIQFDKPIFEQQIIQHYLAEMAVDIEALRSLTYRVAWMVDQEMKVIKEAAMVKLLGSEVYNRVADKALQIHGGIGYIAEYPVERFYRDARITKIYEGTSEIQKNIIAAQLKREYF